LSEACTQDNTLAKQFEDDARDMYTTAVAGVMKGSLLINFSFADFEEVSATFSSIVA